MRPTYRYVMRMRGGGGAWLHHTCLPRWLCLGLGQQLCRVPPVALCPCLLQPNLLAPSAPLPPSYGS